MSKTRAIKVESCHDCDHAILRKSFEWTTDKFKCALTGGIIDDLNIIPSSCPLPKWPLATREEIEQLFLPYGMHPQMFIEWLKFRGVEIKGAADA